ncbi:MAG: PspC domain-containing protein [Tannerella sp.]|jgi:phage shock protein PspC (stress-responsive transcriptional regulator)|nr:PspC domain-containing protein [Tannerella sp.]
MKKTLTVNLGGIVFNIDEDAYQLLADYLSNLRIHFSREEGSDEIMDDFETRISELLNERIRLGYQVITIEHVENVIKRMGKPEEIFATEDASGREEKKQSSAGAQTEKAEKAEKRLMRDPDNRMLGGVAGGLALFLGIDVTIIRLILLVLLFLPVPVPFSLIIVLYLILWTVIPLANTAADKLTMRGEQVNIENIGKTVTDNFEKITSNVNEYIHSDKPRTALQRIGDCIVAFFGIIIKVSAVLLGIVLFPICLLIVFVLLLVIIAFIVSGISSLSAIPFISGDMNMISDMPEWIVLIGTIGTLLFIGIPLVRLVYALCGKFMKINPMSASVKWVLIILWFISFILSAVAVYYAIRMSDIPIHINYLVQETFDLFDLTRTK